MKGHYSLILGVSLILTISPSWLSAHPVCDPPTVGFSVYPATHYSTPENIVWVVAVGASTTLDAQYPHSYDWETFITWDGWSSTPSGGSVSDPAENGYATGIWSSPGDYVVEVTVSDHDYNYCQPWPDCCVQHTESAHQHIRAIQVDHLEYLNPDGVFVDVPSTLYVAKDATVTLKAIPTPDTPVWAYHMPEWACGFGVDCLGDGYGDSQGRQDFDFYVLSSGPGDYKVVTATCGNSKTVYAMVKDWRPGPVPTGTIRCSNGQKWDHINDTRDWIPLEIADGVDHDDKLVSGSWVTQSGNYIDLALTEWYAHGDEGYCYPPNGASTKWYATSTGQPTWVKAKLKDSTTSPSPSADDPSPWTAEWTDLHGFKVGVRASFNGAWTDVSPTVWEGQDWGYNTTSTWLIQSYKAGPGSAGSQERTCYFSAFFTRVLEPTGAIPSGFVKANLTFGLDACWSGFTSDCDLNDGPGNPCTLTFTMTPGGIGGSFTYSWNTGDSKEAIATGDYAYTTVTGLGANRVQAPPGTPPLLKYQSCDNPDIPPSIVQFSSTRTLSRAETLQWTTIPVGGQFDISAASYSTGHCGQDVAYCECRLQNPVVHIQDVEYIP